MKTMVNNLKTTRVKRKWDRNACFYDILTNLMERSNARVWYEILWRGVKGPMILEVGVGTGRSFPYYPEGTDITAIDLSDRMLARAKQKAKQQGFSVKLEAMDVQALDFADNSFDSVVAACTFCSVPDPVMGLQEIRRVIKPDGKIFLLEHMRHNNKFLGKMMDWLNFFTIRFLGPSINRRTLDNIKKAGLKIESVEDIAMGGIFKFIVAIPDK